MAGGRAGGCGWEKGQEGRWADAASPSHVEIQRKHSWGQGEGVGSQAMHVDILGRNPTWCPVVSGAVFTCLDQLLPPALSQFPNLQNKGRNSYLKGLLRIKWDH